MAADINGITGLVLAGGKSSRMGGVDKALITLNGRPMIEWVIERLRPQVDSVLINSRNERLRDLGFALVDDIIVDQPGPLAGLHAGLQACHTPLLACVPCDSPLLPKDLVARLHAALPTDADIAVARTSRGLQPTFLLCRRRVAASIEPYLVSGRRALHQWLATQRCAEAVFDADEAFSNANTYQELAHIAQMLR